MAIQAIDRQKAKHQMKTKPRSIPLTRYQQLKNAEHEAWVRELKYIRQMREW